MDITDRLVKTHKGWRREEGRERERGREWNVREAVHFWWTKNFTNGFKKVWDQVRLTSDSDQTLTREVTDWKDTKVWSPVLDLQKNENFGIYFVQGPFRLSTRSYSGVSSGGFWVSKGWGRWLELRGTSWKWLGLIESCKGTKKSNFFLRFFVAWVKKVNLEADSKSLTFFVFLWKDPINLDTISK